MRNPTLGITMGDAAGIGPEITAKTMLRHPELREHATLVVIGDSEAMRRGAQSAGLDAAAVKVLDDPSEATNNPNTIEVVQTGPSLAHIIPGKVHPAAGDGSYRFVVEACRLAKAQKLDGIVTAPLNKAAMHAGGHLYPGHTELLAEQFGVKNFSLVLSAGDVYFFHLTTHVSLRQAIENVTPTRTTNVINLAAAFCRALNRPDEKISLAGLNPHAGENRLFGNEDEDILRPAVEAAQRRGIAIQGPLPADAIIPQVVHGELNMLIVCYHDQGHVPFKSVYGDEGVNITAGLPVVRVSVDHGTAFDIAGKGIAREASLVLSVERATALSPGWANVWQAASCVDERTPTSIGHEIR